MTCFNQTWRSTAGEHSTVAHANLGGSGRLWEALGGSGNLWDALGGFWEALGGSGRPWEALGCSGKLWEALGGSGRLLEALGSSGRLWEALGGSEPDGDPLTFRAFHHPLTPRAFHRARSPRFPNACNNRRSSIVFDFLGSPGLKLTGASSDQAATWFFWCVGAPCSLNGSFYRSDPPDRPNGTPRSHFGLESAGGLGRREVVEPKGKVWGCCTRKQREGGQGFWGPRFWRLGRGA